MSQILFGQSYYLRFDPKTHAAMRPYPPLGTLYAASVLRQRGYDLALFDAMLAQSEDEWAAALDQHRPRYAVLYEDNFNYLSKMCLLRMRQAAFVMIELAKARGCTIILCGADVTDHAHEYFLHHADYALMGEGEETLGELLDHLEGRSGVPLEGILGLAWMDAQGEEHYTPRRPDIALLDALPFPAWDLVDIPRYRAIWRQRHGYHSMNMVSTRGCPYTCAWCAKPIWGQRYASRSPENVVAEQKWLKATYHPDHIWFADDIFGLREGWIERYAQVVRAEDAVIPFMCLMRADLVRPSVVEGLAAAGCQSVWLGAESGSPRILQAMEKGTTVAQIREARRLLGGAGIKVGFFLQFGYPGETRADIEQTLQMLRETMPEEIGISVSYPLPGTRLYEQVRSRLGPRQNWVHSDDLSPVYQSPYPPWFYRRLYDAVHHEFQMRRAWLELTAGSVAARTWPHPAPWPLRGLRLLAALPWRWLKWQWARRGWAFTRALYAAPPSPETCFQDTRQAFDSVAANYDGPLGNNALIQRMRERMWRTLLEVSPPPARLLDLGCGTGLDAAHLAERGYQVVASDGSAEMVARTRQRVQEGGLGGRVSVRVLGIQELGKLRGELYDGIYSDLGPLNCLPDLEAVAADCAALLKPQGKVVVTVMGRRCPWEFAFYSLRGDLARARLRSARGMVPVTLNGHTVWTRYVLPREFYRAFAREFALTRYLALGLFTPPPYLVRFTERWPALGRTLGWLDDRLGALPILRDVGDHFLMVLTKRDGHGSS